MKVYDITLTFTLTKIRRNMTLESLFLSGEHPTLNRYLESCLFLLYLSVTNGKFILYLLRTKKNRMKSD